MPIVDDAPREGSRSLKVGTIGRICAQKDPRHYADVIMTLRRDIPDVSSTWIGGGENDDLGAIQLDNHTTTGWLSGPEVAQALQELDLYIHTAAWEGFPIAILDAHASHVPVLARRISAYADLPESLTLQAGLSPMIDAHAAGQFERWADENMAAWDKYLQDHNRASLAAALRAAWLEDGR
jgi:glycosyltransferase involved in cell wall biosynthesis